MLAMYVCFDNPNPMVADYPTAYVGQPGFDFIQLVPTWWDETKVLEGEPGRLLVTARRKGGTWYLGGMSAKEAHDLSIPLSFLGNGSYTARVWKDAADAEIEPNHLTFETLHLSSSEALKVHLSADGGFTAELVPSGK
jgi:alpha-glucosidase